VYDVASRASSAANKANRTVPIDDYEHAQAKRTNNPPSGLAHLDRDATPTRQLSYDPHLDPQLGWAGKAERQSVDIPAPSIHVHEELSAQRIIGSVRRQRTQAPLFDIDTLDPADAVDFYRHDLNWSNRMILGDSLVVMNSLLERERMAGKVQCVFIDPPYGIKYGSNFQPSIGNRTVKDGADASLTREPEMIQAYRDTWELGVHSYLTYLRDRFSLTRELLTDTGSVFVQIGEENVHRVRILLDEVFGSENFISQIAFVTTSGAGSPGELKNIPATCNYLIWYAKDKSQMKYRQLYTNKRGFDDDPNYRWLELPDGTRRSITKSERDDPTSLPLRARPYRISDLTSQSGDDGARFVVNHDGRDFSLSKGSWKTGREGMERLKSARRVQASGQTLSYVRFWDDFLGSPLVNVWTDTIQSGFASKKQYVVQTNPTVIARCMLMTSDPGDLVLDPTCGSGTSAYVAEQYGRRWITIDTSRVALAIARERLLTARYDYYTLRDSAAGVDAGMKYKQLDRVTLRSIARGEDPEPISLFDQPEITKGKVRVSGPFTFEALSRYAINPTDDAVTAPDPAGAETTSDHVNILLAALEAQGVPRPGGKPLPITSLTPLAVTGSLQAEGVLDRDGTPSRFAVSLGPKFGAVTMAQVSDALRQAIGYDLIVFAGFAVSADAQDRLGTGKVGGTDVALLLANPDLLVGDLLKNTTASQTFRLYASPDVEVSHDKDGYRVEVVGVDSYDALTGDVTSIGASGVQAWFLDEDYDGAVFRVSQAFFPVTNAWEKLTKTLRGTGLDPGCWTRGFSGYAAWMRLLEESPFSYEAGLTCRQYE
jgi:adenine-specific DNA-methyltransferase